MSMVGAKRRPLIILRPTQQMPGLKEGTPVSFRWIVVSAVSVTLLASACSKVQAPTISTPASATSSASAAASATSPSASDAGTGSAGQPLDSAAWTGGAQFDDPDFTKNNHAIDAWVKQVCPG
jgi:hypothetical protein